LSCNLSKLLLGFQALAAEDTLTRKRVPPLLKQVPKIKPWQMDCSYVTTKLEKDHFQIIPTLIVPESGGEGFF